MWWFDIQFSTHVLLINSSCASFKILETIKRSTCYSPARKKGGKKRNEKANKHEKNPQPLESQFWGNTWDWSIRLNSATNCHMWLSPSVLNPGCHQTGARLLCVQASVWLQGPCWEWKRCRPPGAQEGLPGNPELGGLSGCGSGPQPLWSARRAQLDSALTHHTAAGGFPGQQLRAACPCRRLLPSPFLHGRPVPPFKQQGRFYSFWIPTKQGTDWLCFLWL